MIEFLQAYLLFMNFVSFSAMGLDKAKAKAGAWRVPEKILLGFAIFGAGPGVWLGMDVFRHKTKHWYFRYGVPFIVLLELGIAIYFLDFLYTR